MATPRLLVAVLALLLVVPAIAGTQGKPTLRLAKVAPLTLRATGFEARERVELTLVRGRMRVERSAIASATGTFTARFPLLLAVEPCRSLSVRAVGSKGSRALYQHRCRPADPALPSTSR
jgi:hypothetical protein